MFKPLSLYIGLRYTRTQRHGRFISLISLVSLLGIALGVMVLITVLSVMNGFDEQIHNRVFSMAPHMMVSNLDGSLEDWHRWLQVARGYPGIVAATPYVSGQGLASSEEQSSPIMITGILPEEENKVSNLAEKMLVGKVNDLKPGQFSIILGKGLAERLSVLPGDSIIVLIPQVNTTLVGVIPRYKNFKVVGIFQAGTGFGFDNTWAFTHMQDAQRFFEIGKAVTGIRMKLKNLYDAPKISYGFAGLIPRTMVVTNWVQQYGALFAAIQMEKTMMFFILLLIIGVAAFNMVAMMVMIVNEKRADIAILRTLGATPGMVMRIFIVQGFLVGAVGTLLGCILGVLLAYNVTDLVNWLEKLTQVQFVSSNIYFVDFLPSRLDWTDVAKICSVTLLLSLFATLYPARRASRMQPAEALRYE